MVGSKRVTPPPTSPAPASPAAPSGVAPSGPPNQASTAPPPASGPVTKELNAFTRFAKARAERGGPWRDFHFTQAAPFIAELLNTAGKSDPTTAATLAQSIGRSGEQV
jgi:hypothetical protein